MISVAIMAHKKREHWVPGILEKLDADAEVVWDRINDRHETGLRSILAYDPKASHHLIVQDDGIFCRDLVATLSKAIEFSGDRPLCLYTGKVQPQHSQIALRIKAAQHAKQPWFAMEGPWWGVGILLPTGHIPKLAEWFESSDVENYDRRISRWYSTQGIDCLYTIPSLVDHRVVDNPSLTDRPGRRRSARLFIGENVSGLTVEWKEPAEGTFAAGRLVSFDDITLPQTFVSKYPRLVVAHPSGRRMAFRNYRYVAKTAEDARFLLYLDAPVWMESADENGV